MEDTMAVPPWLEKLLNTDFFAACRSHGSAARSECNMYCLDCNSDAFCFYCRSSKHKDHQVIQIRRSSYHDVVRVSEIQRVLNISGVQTYVINSARVLFLNERPQPKAAGGKLAVSHVCQICRRSLLDNFNRFCSLGCKVVGIKRNGDASSFSVDAKNDHVVIERSGDEGGISRRMNNISSSDHQADHQAELREAGSQHDMYPTTPPPPFSARRRKGIPQRAPLCS